MYAAEHQAEAEAEFGVPLGEKRSGWRDHHHPVRLAPRHQSGHDDACLDGFA